MKRFLFLATALLFQHSVQASTWNAFAKGGNEAGIFHFDADTVEKKGNTVTLWIKLVRTSPDSEGNWAISSRTEFNCARKTTQSLYYSFYDKSNSFVRSVSKAGEDESTPPDSIGESLMKAVCSVNFPRKSDLYYPVANNDIFAHTQGYVKYLESLKKDRAPQ